jgi:hypothetical protein
VDPHSSESGSGYGSGYGSSILSEFDPDPVGIQGFNDQKFKKSAAEIFLSFFGSKIAIYLS